MLAQRPVIEYRADIFLHLAEIVTFLHITLHIEIQIGFVDQIRLVGGGIKNKGDTFFSEPFVALYFSFQLNARLLGQINIAKNQEGYFFC